MDFFLQFSLAGPQYIMAEDKGFDFTKIQSMPW